MSQSACWSFIEGPGSWEPWKEWKPKKKKKNQNKNACRVFVQLNTFQVNCLGHMFKCCLICINTAQLPEGSMKKQECKWIHTCTIARLLSTLPVRRMADDSSPFSGGGEIYIKVVFGWWAAKYAQPQGHRSLQRGEFWKEIGRRWDKIGRRQEVAKELAGMHQSWSLRILANTSLLLGSSTLTRMLEGGFCSVNGSNENDSSLLYIKTPKCRRVCEAYHYD